MTAVLIALSLVVALLSLLVAGLLRSHAEILRQLHDLGTAAETEDGRAGLAASRRDPATTQRRATDLTGTDVTGNPQVVRVAGVDHDTVLLFLSTGCTTCESFWASLRRPGDVTLPAGARLVVVTHGAGDESPAAVARLVSGEAVTVMSDEAWADYGVPGTPYVVHVDGRSGRVRGEGTGASWEQVARLLAQATGDLRYVGRAMSGRRKPTGDAERERAIDSELLAAGILPGDDSLYPPAAVDASPLGGGRRSHDGPPAAGS